MDAIYKELKNGLYLCNICSAEIKSKAWTAHINGKRHRENVQRLKEVLLAKANQKRKHDEEEEEELNNVTAKKRKDVAVDNEEPGVSNQKTPWQSEVDSLSTSQSTTKKISVKKVEGLPENFFDNGELNIMSKETEEKQKHLDNEVDRLMKEIAEAEDTQKEEDDVEEETSAVQREIELIDEQIGRWREINELEKKKEQVVENLTARFEQQPNFDRMEGAESDEDSDLDNFDFNSINWRAKIL